MSRPGYTYIRKYFTVDGRQYEVSGRTEAECYEKMGKKKAAIARGEDGISGNMLVRAWCKQYITTYIAPRVRPAGESKKEAHSLTKKSAGMYREKLEGYIIPAIGSLRLKEVTPTHLQQILNDQAGRSFSHVNKLRCVMQQLFHAAHVQRLILFDPALDLSMPYVVKRTRRSLTPEEDTAFRAVAATHPHGLWAEFHIAFGVRPGEVPPLRVKDLDFVSHRLHVSQAVESGTNAIKDPKTTAGVRQIPIPPDLEPRLAAYVAGRNPFEFLFPGEGGQMMSQSGIVRRWKSFKRALDIYMGATLSKHGKIIESRLASDLTLYCTRHTYCTELGAKGIDASVGRFVTGHKDVSTLANIYMHSNDAVVQSIADRLYATKKAEPSDAKSAAES